MKYKFDLKYLAAIIEEMNDACGSWGIKGIVDKPLGDRQGEYIGNCPFDHTFIYQQGGMCEDDYWGSQYFPIDDDKYLEVWFAI